MVGDEIDDVVLNPSLKIDIDTDKHLKEVKKYIEVNSFTFTEMIYLFSELDKELINYKKKSLKDFVKFSSGNEVEFSLVEEKVRSKKKKLIDNYDKFRLNFSCQILEGDFDVEKTKSRSKLTIRQIALIHAYQGPHINRNNSESIIKSYGHNSGEKLFQQYTYYSSQTNRKSMPTPATRRKLLNKIDLLDSVIELLSDDSKPIAIDELKILKSLLKNEYY